MTFDWQVTDYSLAQGRQLLIRQIKLNWFAAAAAAKYAGRTWQVQLEFPAFVRHQFGQRSGQKKMR